MHILTKIFIVLVTMLAIFMVPLVVVSAKNQEYWKTRSIDLDASHRLVTSQLQDERQAHQSEQARLNQELQTYSQRLSELQSNIAACEKMRLEIESQLLTANLAIAEHGATSRTMLKSLQTNSDLNRVLVEDLQKLRGRAISAEREKLELDDALRERDSQLQVALAARRKLEEELKEVRDEQTNAMQRISEYVARFGALEDSGMTLDEVESTAALIRDINHSYSMVVVEHDMKFIRMIAETVTVFHQGKILAEDHVDAILRDAAVRDVYLGKQADRDA